MAWLLASRERQLNKNTYGIPLEEAMDPDLADEWEAELVIDYAAATVKRMHDYYTSDEFSKSDQAGWGWIVHRNTE